MPELTRARSKDDPRPLSPLNWRKEEKIKILQRISEANIIGMGGGGYPTAEKISRVIGHDHPVLIGNGLECDPYVTADATLLLTELSAIVEGLEIIARIVDASDVFLAIRDKRLRDRVRKISDVVQPKFVQTQYPAGEERNVVSAVTGVLLNRKQYPTDLGIVVLNVATLFAVCEAVRDGFPPLDRMVTCLGKDQWLRIGAKVSDLGLPADSVRIGGPATGVKATRSSTIEATTNAVSVDLLKTSNPCIHCSRCTSACPVALPVEHLYTYTIQKDVQKLERLRIEDCYECGACAIACPSSLPLLDGFRASKEYVRSARAYSKKASAAKSRFQQRSDRLRVKRESHDSQRVQRIRQRRIWN